MQKGRMRQRRLCRFRMRRRFERKRLRAREGVSFLSGAGEELGYLRFVAVWGGKKRQSRSRAPIWDQVLKWAKCFYIRFENPLIYI